jgi:hypothetical protein
MGPRAGLDDVEKRKFLILPGLELRPLGLPARSQWLHRLRYRGFQRQGDGVQFPVASKDVSLLHNVQMGYGVHPARCTMGT